VATVRTAPDVQGTALYRKTLGCLIGGIVGDAMGTSCEGKTYQQIEQQLGWVNDFTSDGTDDTVMKDLLALALIKTDGHAMLDDWAAVMLEEWDAIFGPKRDTFFISVIHMANKLKRHSVPRMAALGNMPSSSSAMCISPVGMVNACDPRAAALQAYNLASLIHVHEVGFCQDAAAAMAAAVAEAYRPDATVESVLEAATVYIPRLSGAEMLAAIDRMVALARQTRDYKAFRAAAYQRSDELFCRITCDSRETVPLALALFYLADGDVERAITYGANFGRDADTVASMVGAIAGAQRGVEAIKPDWIEKIKQYSKRDQPALAADLAAVALRKRQAAADVDKTFASIAQGG
jgi:ADP-ribosylglycohydrolase